MEGRGKSNVYSTKKEGLQSLSFQFYHEEAPTEGITPLPTRPGIVEKLSCRWLITDNIHVHNYIIAVIYAYFKCEESKYIKIRYIF